MGKSWTRFAETAAVQDFPPRAGPEPDTFDIQMTDLSHGVMRPCFAPTLKLNFPVSQRQVTQLPSACEFRQPH